MQRSFNPQLTKGPSTPAGIPTTNSYVIKPLEAKSESYKPVKQEINNMKSEALEEKLRDDCINLEAEVKTILHKSKLLKINIGTDSEMTKMVQNTNSIQEFLDEITETTNSQASEV